MKNTPFSCFLIFFFFLIVASDGCTLTPRYEVRIINQLPWDNHFLVVHCASGSRDLGFHNLTSWNEEFHWDFCDDIFHRTLYFCHLWWEPRYNRAFDVFRSTAKRNACAKMNICWWLVRPDGIHFTDDFRNTPATLTYKWQLDKNGTTNPAPLP